MPEGSKEQIFDFVGFYSQKTNMADMEKLEHGCINGCTAQKWLISAEGCILTKCKSAFLTFLFFYKLQLWLPIFGGYEWGMVLGGNLLPQLGTFSF